MADNTSFNPIDTHFHLWELKRFKYQWPTEKEKKILRDFTIGDYNKARSQTPVRYGVFVEAHNSIEETRWALELAKESDSPIKGVVGYVDMAAPIEKLDGVLTELTQNRKLVGARNILDLQPEGWLGQTSVMEGMKVLEKYNLTYDLLIRKKNFADALKVVRLNPKVKFVIDHIAKPDIKSGEVRDWFDGMAELAAFENVQCKLSGMVTEADLDNWKPDHFLQYVGHVVKKFGSDRIMFGSDWPVCRMANTDFDGVYNLLHKILDEIEFEDKKKVFETNAIEFYNLQI